MPHKSANILSKGTCESQNKTSFSEGQRIWFKKNAKKQNNSEKAETFVVGIL